MNKARDKRQLITETAMGLFSRFGFTKTSLDDIASAAQIAKGTVYYYFPSKEELFISVIEQKLEEYFSMLQEHIDELEGFEQKLREMLHVPISFMYEHMPVLIEGLRTLPFNYKDRLLQFREITRNRIIETLLGILKLGADEGLLNESLNPEKICEVLSNWFLLGDSNVEVVDMKKLIDRIEADHEMIIQVLLYGIIKRGNK